MQSAPTWNQSSTSNGDFSFVRYLSSTASTMHPYLPPELIESIIEQITDRETLAVCSLICWAWAPIAQSKYFRNLHFGPSPDETVRFHEMLRESPHIALLPRSIESKQWDARDGDDRTYLARIAPLLINVSKLTLTSVYLPYYSSRDTRRTVEGFPSLRELRLLCCIVDLQSLSLFFQSHPTLCTLSLDTGKIIGTNYQYQELLPLKQLKHLQVLYTSNISLLVPLLVDHEIPLAQIEHLKLIIIPLEDELEEGDNAVYTLLLGLRHILHVLEIGVPSLRADVNDHTLDSMCISSNFSLE
jgi:hypothetical protein